MIDKNPKEIWLQIGIGQEDEDRTWCVDKINDTDVKYIREDQLKSLIRSEVNKAKKEERTSIGLSFEEWLCADTNELIEDAIKRITKVEV